MWHRQGGRKQIFKGLLQAIHSAHSSSSNLLSVFSHSTDNNAEVTLLVSGGVGSELASQALLPAHSAASQLAVQRIRFRPLSTTRVQNYLPLDESKPENFLVYESHSLMSCPTSV